MSILRECARREDMSQRGELSLIMQDDGDIIVSVLGVESGGPLYQESHVEFCSIGSCGGRSPKVRQALLQLMDAIDQDIDKLLYQRVQVIF
jgi:hypothetical protein